MTGLSVHSLSDFFQPGIDPDGLSSVNRLTAAWPYLSVFITLFRGGDEEVLLRLLVLRELGNRADAPLWTPAEIAQRFAYLNPTKLDTILKRLREGELLVWESDGGRYQLSEGARVALAALATMIDFAGDDVELGYLTSQVAAGQAVGQVSDEALRHLLARLNELYAEFEAALESQSEFRIRAAQHRLDAVWRWVAKSTEVVRRLTADDTLDLATLNQAQAIALAQSRMLALAGTFERRLAQLAAQRVHLGSSGLTSTDIADWLRRQQVGQLATQLSGCLSICPEPAFLATPELADVAEFELLARERAKAGVAVLPGAEAAPLADAPEVERLFAAEAMYDELLQLGLELGESGTAELPIARAVLADSYNETAYRLSLLSLLGDPESRGDASIVAALAKLPLQLAGGEAVIEPDHPEVAALSDARLRPHTPN
ncbi:hypothetical protein NH8B_3676 [Pseudogulbenkiania sp. NH8B]|uniref:hypothetical protein n=1 Tax=Pseudogulbenkiania sp. (strain NH8B) TaxID=748280 RepID=UPI000227A7A7|nr:hypothetical protein [Pseudogulbenkiania sp. NH8B]BAK78425.1 hypothetical protein NH8B_3676 [Pseudogulbenkiania sp. NH8B]